MPSDSTAAAVTRARAQRPMKNTDRWRSSMRRHNSGMKLADTSGSGQASRYARNMASNSAFSLPRFVHFILLYFGFRRTFRARFVASLPKRLQDPVPGPKQPHLKSILLDPVNFFKFFQ